MKNPTYAATRRDPEYVCWHGIRSRCHNPNNKDYALYGARGISVCPRWRNSYTAFLSDVGLKPTPSHSLDRINPNGNYEPSNVRWATPSQQANNTRTNRRVTINGKEMTLAQASRAHGQKPAVVSTRLSRGWPLASALQGHR